MFLSFVQVITRLVLGGVFFWAGIAKVPEIEVFPYAIPTFGLLPEFFCFDAKRGSLEWVLLQHVLLRCFARAFLWK